MNPDKSLWLNSIPRLRKIAKREGINVQSIKSPLQKKPWIDAISAKRGGQVLTEVAEAQQ